MMNSLFLPSVLFFQTLFFLILLHYRDGIQVISYDFYGLILFFASLLASLTFALLLHGLLFRMNKIYGMVSIFFSLIYSTFAFYHYRVKSNFNFNLIVDNWNEAFSSESLSVILGTFKAKDIWQIFAISFLVGLLYFFPRWYKSRKLWRCPVWLTTVVLIFYSIIIFIRFPFFDELTPLFQSIYEYHSPMTEKNELYLELDRLPRPFHQSFAYSSLTESSASHVFVIAMESFSSLYVKKSFNGKEVTPFINSLISNSIYVPNFVSNSIQTAKGHFSILCGLPPLINGKAFYYSDKLQLNCLPQVLKSAGYKTLFFQHYADPSFDHTRDFSLKNGFDLFATADPSKASSDYRWGWGLQDDLSFKQFFDLWDKEKKTKTFSFIATISHHMRFRDVPKRYWSIFPDANGDKEKSFINSLHASDLFLRTFFDELKKRGVEDKSIVVLVGDHGYPNGQHGGFHNESRFYQESFAVPLLIYAPSLLAPRVIQKSYSQIDIAPTLYHILGLKGEASLLGTSIFSNGDSLNPMIQPYDGTFLAMMSYPYKYVFHLRTKREYLFNLKNDPMEVNNIIDEFANHELLTRMRLDIGRLYLFDNLVKNAPNRL